MSAVQNVLDRAAVKVPVGSVRSTQVLVDDLAEVLRSVAVERDRLHAIVTALAACDSPTDDVHGVCHLCEAPVYLTEGHNDTCPWLLAQPFRPSATPEETE